MRTSMQKNDPIELQAPINASRKSCQAINRRGVPCKSPAMPGSNFCTHHAPSISKAVKGASRGAAGTAGYIAGLLSGAASSDFFEYLKEKSGYKHFFPPVKSEGLTFDDIKIGSTDYEPRDVARCFLEKHGSDFLFRGDHDMDWVLAQTKYFFYPIAFENRPQHLSRISGILESAKVLMSNGNSGMDIHLLFIHSDGKCKYVGEIGAVWIEVETQEKLVVQAFSGKGWDGSEGWRDTHVFDEQKGEFLMTERQVHGYYYGDGIFGPGDYFRPRD